MSTHVITHPATTHPADGDATGEATAAPAPGWLALSAALTDEAPLIADRDDLLVTITPGAGHGAPACLLVSEAMIEIDGTHLGPLDPATLRPAEPADRTRYAAAWGLLVHECAHARHSAWTAPPEAPAGAVAAATLLEESRIEAAQIRVRPDDRHWLRAATREIILGDVRAADRAAATADPADVPALTRTAAAQTAALVLARVDGGILTPAEAAPVRAAVEATLGADTVAELTSLWRAAHDAACDDTDTMIDLGRRWCQALGTDPATAPPTPDPATTPGADPTAGPGASGSPSPDTTRSPLGEAVEDTLRAVAAHVAAEAPPDPVAARAAREKADRDAHATATAVAHRVFTSDTDPTTGATAVSGTRPPTPAERGAARRIGRALSTAGIRERTAVRTGSVMPPGRLRMRGALAADAQRAAGALPTAEPFVRTTRRVAPAPPLRLGIACDVSGSMGAFADPVASAAWILAHAAHHTHVPATSATVIFGARVRAITRPGTPPPTVTTFHAADGYEQVDTAIDALDGALDLAGRGAARLLVIVSDGHFRPERRAAAQARVDRLRATGCAVLWLAPSLSGSAPLDHVTVVELADPAATAHAIGHAATAALRAATR